MRSLRIAALELKRLASDSFLVRGAVVAITIVPLLYGALYLWAFWDPYGNLAKLPVALVNNDRPVMVDGERVSAGEDLAKKLVEKKTFGWHEVNSAEASAGVADGRYYLVLEVPRDFSANLATAKSEHPVRARLLVTAHESQNMLASQIAERAFTEVRSAAAESASKGYLDKIFVGFADAHGGFTDAAAGAKDLASGLRDARDGARKLADGTATARQGATTLASGLNTLDAGAAKADTGAHGVAAGSKTLASGLAQADDASALVAGGASKVSAGAGDLAGGIAQLSSGANDLSAASGQLSAGAAQLDAGVKDALSQVGSAATGASQVSAGAAGVDAALHAYVSAHPEAASDPAFAQAIGTSAVVKAGAAQLSAGLADAAAKGPVLAGGAKQVADGSAQLSAGAKKLAAGLASARSGASDLAGGAKSLAGGSAQLEAGVAKAAAGAGTLAAGSTKLASGTTQLATGAHDAAAGAGTLASGLGRLEDGAHDLATGLSPAVSGSRELADGLTAGADKVPAYSAGVQAANAEMMSNPVDMSTTKLGHVANYGSGFTPYFVPLALWIGALMMWFVIKPLPPRALASGAPAWRTVLAGYLPAAAIGLAQAFLLVGVLQLGLGLHPVDPLALYAFVALLSLVFVAILQLLSAALGAAGKLVAIVLLMLQLTSSAGTFPIQTVPTFFQAINPYLPMTYAVAGLRQAISGGDMHALAGEAAMLAVFGLGALLLSAVTAHRNQTWTMERLHPSLEI